MVAVSDDKFAATRNPIRAIRKQVASRRAQIEHPPGPVGRPVTGVLRQFRQDPFEYLRTCGAIYGDVFRVPLPLLDVVAVGTPDLVRDIMCDTTKYSMIGHYAPIAHRLFGKTLPILEGNPFRERRKLITPMFKHSSLEVMVADIVDEFTVRIDKWAAHADAGQPIDLQYEIAWLTMPAFMRAMFGISPSDERIGQLDHDLRMLLSTFAAAVFLSPAPKIVPFRRRATLPAAWRRLSRWIDEQIEHRLANPIEQVDMLQVLLEARDEDGKPLSRQDLIAELAILIAGGYETVVASASWTLALIGTNPEALQRLITEWRRWTGQHPSTRI